jgi:hypothetical protein
MVESRDREVGPADLGISVVVGHGREVLDQHDLDGLLHKINR